LNVGIEHPPKGGDDADSKNDSTASTSLLTQIGDWVLRNPAVAISIVGLFTYGLLRFDYVLFYGGLGVTPEDVGLTYSNVLAQSLAGVAVFILLFGATFVAAIIVLYFLPVVVGVPLGLLIGVTFKRAVQRTHALIQTIMESRVGIALVLLVLVLIPVVGILTTSPEEELIGLRSERWYNLLLGSFLAGVFIGLAHLPKAPKNLTLRRPGDVVSYAHRKSSETIKNLGIGRSSLALVILLFGVEAALVLLPFRALEAADDVKRGESIQGLHILSSIPILTLRAEHARVFNKDSLDRVARSGYNANLQISGDCWMYLGQAGGVAVFYDVRSEQAIRVPSGEVAISTQGKDHCK
jgi:hypothetical protein